MGAQYVLDNLRKIVLRVAEYISYTKGDEGV